MSKSKTNIFKCSISGLPVQPQDQTQYTKWYDQLQKCQRTKQKFSDTEFLPVPKNIAPIGVVFPLAKWQPAKTVFKGENYDIFINGIEPKDISQKELGDCYLLSTLAAIAEFPKRVLDIFISQKKNQYGCYALKIIWKGIETVILLDDFIPVNSKGIPFSLKTNGPELWTILIEKAWAKLHGSYYNIEGQLSREVLHDLTGAPSRTFFTCEKQEELWLRLKIGEQRNYIMTAGTYGEDTGVGDPLEQYGLVSGHAYTLIGAFEVKIKNVETKILKLRNPWGSFEWQGKYNDKSAIWNEVGDLVKQQIGFKEERDSDDGIFYMEYKDFIKFFDGVQICYYHDNYIYSSLEVESRHQQQKYFKITILPQEINQKTLDRYYYFQISQKSIRTFDFDFQDENQGKYYSDTSLIICKENDYNNPPIVAVQGEKRDLTSFKYLEYPSELREGVYYGYVRVNWRNKSQNKFGFGCYGASKVIFEEILKKDCPQFEEKIITQYDTQIYGARNYLRQKIEYVGKD